MFNRFKRLAKYKKPLYTLAFTIIKSCKQALIANDQSPSPLTYLETLLTVKDNFKKIIHMKDEGYLFALSVVLSMIPINVISKLYSIIYDYINDALNSKNTIVYKYSVVVVHLLLQSKTKEHWKTNQETLDLFIRLFHIDLILKRND